MSVVDRIAHAAAESGRRIAVAESLTSGALASTLGAGEGAQDWFAGGVVAYQVATKVRVLGVDEDLDPCSAACAEQLAAGARRLLDADIAIAITGVGGPDAEDGHPAGTVYLALSTPSGSRSWLREFDGAPEDVIAASIDDALRSLAHELAA